MDYNTRLSLEGWLVVILTAGLWIFIHNINLIGGVDFLSFFCEVLLAFTSSCILVFAVDCFIEGIENYFEIEQFRVIVLICWLLQTLIFFSIIVGCFFITFSILKIELPYYFINWNRVLHLCILVIGVFIGKKVSFFVRRIFFPSMKELILLNKNY